MKAGRRGSGYLYVCEAVGRPTAVSAHDWSWTLGVRWVHRWGQPCWDRCMPGVSLASIGGCARLRHSNGSVHCCNSLQSKRLGDAGFWVGMDGRACLGRLAWGGDGLPCWTCVGWGWMALAVGPELSLASVG